MRFPYHFGLAPSEKAMLKERVSRGAVLMDEIDPDWAEFIDVEALNLGDPCACIGGQSFEAPELSYLGGFDALVSSFEGGAPDAAKYGFCAGFDFPGSLDLAYKYLTRLWKLEIEERTA